MSRLNRGLFVAMLMASPFVFLANPFCGVPGGDSSIFIYVARCLGRGLIPYRDVFDQKGPLIYFLDAVACSFGGVLGLWILDVLCLFVLIWMLVLVLRESERLFCVGDYRTTVEYGTSIYMVLAFGIVFFHVSACGGNMPEMWIALFAAVSWLLTVKAIRARYMGVWYCFAVGCCVACIALLKFNMLAVAIPAGMTALACGFRELRTIRRGLVNCCWMALGMLAILAPALGWFASHGALDSLWEVYVKYNALYASVLWDARGGFIAHKGRLFWPVLAIVMLNGYMLFDVYKACYKNDSRPWILAVVNMVFLMVAFGLILASGPSHRYYGPVLPACVVPVCYVASRFRSMEWIKTSVLSGCLLLVVGLACVRNRGDVRSQYVQLREMGEKIGVVGSDSVLVLGCDCHAYWALDAWCPIRFPFQGTIGYCSPEYREQIVKDIEDETAEWIIEPRGVLETEGALGTVWVRDTVLSHYSMIAKNSHYGIWRRNGTIR